MCVFICTHAFFLNLLNISCMVFYSYTSTCIFSTNKNIVLHTSRFKIDFFLPNLPFVFQLC